MTTIVALLALGGLSDAALADRSQFSPEDQKYIHYFVGDETTGRLLGWVLSSTSRQVEIESCLPARVAAGLWRVDVRLLGWRREDFAKVLTSHPYGAYSVIVRADWFITRVLDSALSASEYDDGVPAYLRLLYAGTPPKTEAEFVKFWDTDPDTQRHYGQIEGDSQVNVRGRRLIEWRDRHGGYFFVTRDSLRLDTKGDPLENPAQGQGKFDGSEIIVGVLKNSSTQYSRGAVQYYLLVDGSGNVVHEAPVRLVQDSTNFGGLPSIRTAGSCMQCHVEGIRPIDTNAVIDLQKKFGTAIFDSRPDEFRRYHYVGLTEEVEAAQRQYARGVQLHTGWTGEQLSEAVKSVVDGYYENLSLQGAAEELGVKSARLRQTIVHYGQANPIPAGISMLAQGGACSRDLFEQQYSFLDSLLKQSGKAGSDTSLEPASQAKE